MLPILLLLVSLLHYGWGLRWPNFRRWCRHYAADLLLLEPPLHYGEGQCCSKFRRGGRRYAARFTDVGVGVTLPKMFCWYLARMRTFTQLSDGDFVSFCGTNTLLLLVVGALQHYFCLPRSLTQHTPSWLRPPPLPRPCCPFASGFFRRGCAFVAEREAVHPLPPRATRFRPIFPLRVSTQDPEGRCGKGVQRQWDSRKPGLRPGLP